MLDTLSIITNATTPPDPLGVAFPLRLRRAWPRDAIRLGLQYTDQAGRRIPAQWHADPEQTLHILHKTRRSSRPACIASAGGNLVAVQPDGAESKLPALAHLLETPGASLVTHRPGRRAVVRIPTDTGVRYAKVLRPSRTSRILQANRLVAELPGRAFEIPPLERADAALGLFETRELEGENLHRLLRADPFAFVRGCHAAGRALRSLHTPVTDAAEPHDANAEIAMLAERCSAVECFIPSLAAPVRQALQAVTHRLRSSHSPRTLVHRDFYDKQIVIRPDGSPAILDFDTLGIGEPALDLANMLVHLELRSLQGDCSQDIAAGAADAFLDGYGPETEIADRCMAYIDATRIRLAILYAFWPSWSALAEHLLAGIGKPSPRAMSSAGTVVHDARADRHDHHSHERIADGTGSSDSRIPYAPVHGGAASTGRVLDHSDSSSEGETQ